MSDIRSTALPLPSGRSSALSGNMLCMFAMLTWAAGFPAAEVLLRAGWDPLFLINMRYALVLSLVVPLWAVVEGWQVLRHANWLRGIWVGGIAFGLGAYLLLWAQDKTDPVLVTIIVAMMPVAATAIEVIQGDRRITLAFVFGLIATLTGGIIAAGPFGFSEFGLGIAAAVASTFIFAWGSNKSVRDFPHLSTLGRTAITFTGGGVVTAVIAGLIWVGGYDLVPTTVFTTTNMTMLAVYGIFSMLISQYLWLRGVDGLGIALASFHMNTTPFYVMLFMVALGATWSWPAAIGAAIVGLGVLIAQRG